VEIFSITPASITSLSTEYGCGEELQVGDSRFAPYLFQVFFFFIAASDGVWCQQASEIFHCFLGI